MQHGKQNVSSTLSMFPPNSNPPESVALPPYSNPAEYPSTSGLPYPQYYPPQAPVMGYPQPYGPPPGGQPYYPNPGVVYPGYPAPTYQSALPPYQQQQQQQQTVIVNQPMGVAPFYVVGTPYFSMVGAIVLSCISFWFCGFLFGGIAFILAMVGKSSAAAGDIHGAIRLRNASIALSVLGIVIAFIVIGVVAGTFGRRNYYYSYCSYYYDRRYYSYYYTCK